MQLLSDIARGRGCLRAHQQLMKESEKPGAKKLDEEGAWVTAARQAVARSASVFLSVLSEGKAAERAAAAYRRVPGFSSGA